MAGPSADRIVEWEGGSLSELVALLQADALPARIEVMSPGASGSGAGEVHLLAGGLADAFAGSLRRDDAMAALQRIESARYLIEYRLPNPESGSLSEPGPHEGNLKDRHLAALMRYCEEYVLTCRLEVWRGQDRAAISYRRGEIVGTIVGGSEGSERLPEVMGWTDGAYEIILPTPVLPQIPGRSREGARTERKRHTTLPMIPGQQPKTDSLGGSPAEAGAKTPPVQRPGTTPPPQPASIAGPPRQAPPPPVTRTPPPQPPQAALARPSEAQPGAAPGPAALRPGAIRPLPPQGTTPRPVTVPLSSPLQPEITARGTPPVPAVPVVPAPSAQPASRPTMQGPGVSPIPPKPGAPIPPKPATPAIPATDPAPQIPARSNPPVAQTAPKAPRKPTPLSVQPAPPAPRKPTPLSVQPVPPPKPKAAPPAQASAASPAATAPAQPPAQSAPSRPAKPPAAPAASNDLLPASGTIQAKPKHGSYLPPTTPPIQIAEEPAVAPAEQSHTPVLVPGQRAKRPREPVPARMGLGDHPVRAYVFVGLAIGVGIVLAYWAYWYLPFGHH